MGRLRLLCALLILATSAFAQRKMTAEELATTVKSNIQLKNGDKEVANFVKTVKLTTKLVVGTVEDLQGQGAGPQTLAALRQQVLASQSLVAAAPPPPPPVYVPPTPPTETEKKEVLVAVTHWALDYTKSLPNFICTQVTTRHIDPTGTESSWRISDTIQEQLSYVDGKENYKVMLVNNLAAPTATHEKLGGATSSGEFGSMLREIFQPDSHAEFEWTRWATLRSRRMHVFSYKISQAYSEYRIYAESAGRTIVAGYHGLIYVDRETNTVMRVTLEADGLENFPVTEVNETLDYDFVKINDRQYLLPLKVDLKSTASDSRAPRGKYLSWNELSFRLYRRFTADATFIVDDSDPVPTEKEQPAKADGKGK